MSLFTFLRPPTRFEPENVSLPELVTLGRIDRMWNGQRVTHLTWTEDRLWHRGLLSKHRLWVREDRRWLFWFEITRAGYAMLERKRAEWTTRRKRKSELSSAGNKEVT